MKIRCIIIIILIIISESECKEASFELKQQKNDEKKIKKKL